MVKKEKGSFFGKIMGGSVTDDVVEETVPEEPMMESEPEELADVDVADEEEMVMDEEMVVAEAVPVQNQNQNQNQRKEKETAPAAANEEWMSDFEGQLNIDMYQTRDNVIIKSTIAGVRPEDIDITVANDMVTIRGARKKEEEVSQDDYFYQECYWGNFSRSVIVPVDIESEDISADLKDGILTVIIPKAAKAKVKKVKVKGL